MSKSKKKNVHGFLTYKSYVFKEKDPVIDMMRTQVQDSGKSYQNLSDASGVSKSSMQGWFHGKVRRPQFATCAAVMGALGKQFILRNK